MKPTLRVDGLANLRDLGGLDRRDGTATPCGVFPRSERLERVSFEGWQALHAYGVRTIIDLRRPDEHSGQVPATIKHIHIDLDGCDETEFWELYEADGRWGTPLYYLAHLQTLPDRLASVLNAATAADYLKSFTNADAMTELHERSFDVEERQQILNRFGHTPESAFRDMYTNLDLELWFRQANIERETRMAIRTWRGAAVSPSSA